jgi:hypothetical protein
MPIDKALYEAPQTSIKVDDGEDIEIVIDEEGATVEIEEEDSVDFYDNLAPVLEEDVLQRVALDLSALFEVDKSSRQDWEMTYAKGLELNGPSPFEEQPVRPTRF